MKKIRTEPRAASLIESMRDLGYSLETALADIVDNSITATSKNVDIFFEANEDAPSICILDDGHGMAANELFEAMRPGCVSPLEERDPGDLGRFGLGLKTASFSQCRRLTVITRKGTTLSGARWDLDDVVEEDAWLLHILDIEEIEQIDWLSRLYGTGTIVLWEKLDRLADQTSGANLKDHLYDCFDIARKHLSIVFHRFLKGEPSLPKINLRINERSIEPFDPYNLLNPATQLLPKEVLKIDGHKITIQPYILPHHKKTTRKDYEFYAGEGGYLKNQGFYVYRNGRLIIHKTWFRIVKQSEMTKLARVLVDIPSSLDQIWKIDVRKASAQPPFVVRARLKQIVERITGASGRVYTSKGKILIGPNIESLWIRKAKHNEISYEINRNHPLLRHFTDMIGEEQSEKFNAFIRAVEQCFPVDAFFADAAGNTESLRCNEIPEDIIEKLMDMAIATYSSQGLSMEDIMLAFELTDPFRTNLATIRMILEQRERTNHVS